ncbi:MAG: hypothetical protein V5A66_06530 [Candidatus Thermoplasmatota archaeon]
MQGKLTKLNSGIEKLFEFLEKDRFTPFTAFIYFLILGVIRSVSESLFFEYGTFSIYLVIQHTAFNFPVFVLGVLVIHKATGTSYRKVLNLVLIGMFIVLAPPFIDRFIFGLQGAELGHIYDYYDPQLTFLEKITFLVPTHILGNESVSPGLRTMAASIFSLSTFYIFFKIELYKIKKFLLDRDYQAIFSKLSRFFFGAFGIWLVVWFISSVVPSVILFAESGEVRIFDYIFVTPKPLYYRFFEQYGYTTQEIFPGIPGVVGLAEGLALQQRSLFVTMFFTALTGISLVGTLAVVKKELLDNIIASIDKSVVLTTTISALLGSGIIQLVDPGFDKGWAIDPTYALHLPYLFYLASMGFFLGCLASFVYSYHDEESLLSKYVSKQLSIVSALAVISFAFLMGPFSTLPLGLIVVTITYFVFANKGKSFDLLTSLSFSSISIFSFLLGFYTPGQWKATIWESGGRAVDVETYETINISRRPELTLSVIGMILILFVMISIVFYLSSLIEKGHPMVEFPKTIAFLPLFLLPSLIFTGLGSFTLFMILGLFSVFLMEEASPKLPIYVICLQFIYILISPEVWGILPSLSLF